MWQYGIVETFTAVNFIYYTIHSAVVIVAMAQERQLKDCAQILLVERQKE